MDIRSAIVQDLIEPFGLYDVDEAKAEGDGEDETVAARPGYEAQDADTGYGDGAVEEDLHAAED